MGGLRAQYLLYYKQQDSYFSSNRIFPAHPSRPLSVTNKHDGAGPRQMIYKS